MPAARSALQLVLTGSPGAWRGRRWPGCDGGHQVDETADGRGSRVDPRVWAEGEAHDRARQQLGRGPDPVGQEAQVRAAQASARSNTRSRRSKAGHDELGLARGRPAPARRRAGAGGRRRARRPGGLRGCRPCAARRSTRGTERRPDAGTAPRPPVLAAREHAVGGGPTDPGLPSDVVERGLADAPTGDAAGGGVDEGPVGGRTDRPVDPGADLGHAPSSTARDRRSTERQRCRDHAETVRTDSSHRPAVLVNPGSASAVARPAPPPGADPAPGDGRRPGRRGPTSRLRPSTTRSCEPAGRRPRPARPWPQPLVPQASFQLRPRSSRTIGITEASPHDLVGLVPQRCSVRGRRAGDGPRRGRSSRVATSAGSPISSSRAAKKSATARVTAAETSLGRTAGEPPVHRRSADAGLPGDVLDGGRSDPGARCTHRRPR